MSAQAYGVALSSNRAIPGLSRSAPARAELEVTLGEIPPWHEAAHAADAQAGRSGALAHVDCGAQRHYLRYADGTRFYLDAAGARIWATWPAALTLEDTATYLLGPVLGFYLRLRGLVCLHGSAALLDGRCIAFVGPAGAGKSTLAAALAADGAPIVTEDVACLDEADGRFVVRPGYPRIRLWEDSARLLAAEGLPALTPNWDKRYLELDGTRHRFHGAPAPLAGICVLQPRRAMAEPAALSTLSGQEALGALIANAYGKRLVNPRMRAHEFEVLGRLARAVPVRALTLNADGARLAEACDWIRRHAPA